ncbi:DUF3316 domain-containing protein [Vibrio sp. F74]|uniref:DUF3316 domain-containing protein n=1 Tax=Vibrio sp. F74 TaxID=700020 RepID=UPI0035F5B4AE
MKFIKKIVITTLMLVSSSVFSGEYVPTPGNFVERLNSSTIDTGVVKTKVEAYKLGLKVLTKLYSSSPRELSKILRINNINYNPKSIHVNDGGYINVEEMMNHDGDILYRGVLNISYHFSERDSRD